MALTMMTCLVLVVSFWQNVLLFLVDRCMFSMGSGDEGDGHLDDHDLLSAASCETVQGDISGCSGVEEVPSPSSASLDGSDVSIQSGNEWPPIGKGCANCHHFLEKRFQEASDKRKTWFFNLDEFRQPPTLYGHKLSKCPFSDLGDQCRYCRTPGKFLNRGMHCCPMQEEPCCGECHYSNFVSASDYDAGMLMTVAEMASDLHIPLTEEEFHTIYIRSMDSLGQDPDSDSD